MPSPQLVRTKSANKRIKGWSNSKKSVSQRRRCAQGTPGLWRSSCCDLTKQLKKSGSLGFHAAVRTADPGNDLTAHSLTVIDDKASVTVVRGSGPHMYLGRGALDLGYSSRRYATPCGHLEIARSLGRRYIHAGLGPRRVR